MNIYGKYALLNAHLLRRIEVVEVNPQAAVSNDEGVIRIEARESTTNQSWNVRLDDLGSKTEEQQKLLRWLLYKCNDLLTNCYGTKKERLEVLRGCLGIDFNELRERKRK